MPVTYWTALIGALALIGTPLFSGFYSKDALIDAVHASQRFGAGYAYWCVLLGVFVTALYTFRMIFMTFHGPERLDQHAREHFHDVGWDMKAPLVALAIPSVIIGYLTVEPILFGGYFGNAIKVLEAHDVVGELKAEWHGPMAFALHSLISAPAWLAALGVYAAWWCVLKRPEFGDAMRERFSGTYRVLVNKYYFDWFNENVLVPLARGLGVALWRGGDEVVIDGALVNGSADAVGRLAGVTRLLQSGFLYSYAFWMIIGLAVSLGWLLIHI
jgi:NADH-quinone oxidoreductase subunit L